MKRYGALLLAVAGLLAGAEDPRAIVRRSLERNTERSKLAENYTFIERQDQREHDSLGRVTKHKVLTYDITITEGSPYRRLIARDDKPLDRDEEAKEQAKLDRSIAGRRAETPEQRRKRVEKRRRDKAHSREFMAEIPDAFDFRMIGEEVVEGRKTWALDATPRPGFKPRTRSGAFLAKMKGRLWIDALDYDWVKVEAENSDTISMGGIVARFAPGCHFSLAQTRVNDEIWLPKLIEVQASARIFLVKKVNIDLQITYKGYKKFQTDTRIIGISENPQAGGPPYKDQACCLRRSNGAILEADAGAAEMQYPKRIGNDALRNCLAGVEGSAEPQLPRKGPAVSGL